MTESEQFACFVCSGAIQAHAETIYIAKGAAQCNFLLLDTLKKENTKKQTHKKKENRKAREASTKLFTTIWFTAHNCKGNSNRKSSRRSHSHKRDGDTFSVVIQGQMALNSYSASRDNWCTVGGNGRCRVGEVWAGTTSPMPDRKGFKLQ